MMSDDKPSSFQASEKGSGALVGPYRSYQPVDTFGLCKVGQIHAIDKVIGSLIAVGFILFMVKFQSYEFNCDVKESEKELLSTIGYYKTGSFYLGPLPHFGFQMLSKISDNILTLRTFSLCLSSITLSIFYLTLRKVNTNVIFSIIGVGLISSLPLFRKEASSVSLEPLQWFLLAITIFSWQGVRCCKFLSCSSLYYMAVLGVSLGLSVATKFIGLFTWIWICILALFELWRILGDVKITTGQLLAHSLWRVFFLGVIPLTIFTSSYVYQLNHWTNDSPEFSTYMSKDFKQFLKGFKQECPDELYYGSTITLRHLESLGGYLHSHDYMYKGGSREQQVTLVDLENDANNEWIIEHRIPAFNHDAIPRVVKDLDRVKLRHRLTGKLLRASTAKPPVSEQEYDLEISCTGDINYNGNSDEVWTINAINGAKKETIHPVKAILKLTNEGQKCVMMAHDIRLPDWGFNQQEVLCLEHATKSRSLFQIEDVNTPSNASINYITFNDEPNVFYKYYKIIYELLQKQYKYNYYVKNYKKTNSVSPEVWPFRVVGDQKIDKIWVSATFSVCLFLAFQLVQLWRYNPWELSNTEAQPLYFQIYCEFGIACCLGWILHYYPFLKSPHKNVDILQFMPSVFIGQLLLWQTFNTSYEWQPFIGHVICCYVAYAVFNCYRT